MKCREVNELLVAYLDGEVTPSERTLIQAHLAGCAVCRKELAALAATQSHVSQSLQVRAAQAAPSPQAWSRLQARLARACPEPSRREARPSSIKSGLQSWLQRLAPDVGRITQIFPGGVTMKKGFALATLVALVIAVSVVAFVPSVRAQVSGWFRARWEGPGWGMEVGGTQPGFTDLVPSYLPDAVFSSAAGNIATVEGDASGMMRNFFFGDPDGQWLLITQGQAPANKALPEGQQVTIGSQKGVLLSGLSGTVEMSIPFLQDVLGEPPAYRPESFDYQDASRLVWYVGDTRTEILSNLPVEEMLKVAKSFRSAETGEGELPGPQPPIMPEQSEGETGGGGVLPQPTPEK